MYFIGMTSAFSMALMDNFSSLQDYVILFLFNALKVLGSFQRPLAAAQMVARGIWQV